MKFKIGDRVFYCGTTYTAEVFEMPGVVMEVSHDPFPYDVEFRYLDSGDSTLLLCSEFELAPERGRQASGLLDVRAALPN